MPVAAVMGGAAIIGAGTSIYAADTAADAQSDAAFQANKLQKQIYQQNRADFAPWREAGGEAINAYKAALGLSGPDAQQQSYANFTNSPGYQFGLTQGIQAVDRGAGAQGMLYSGARAKALERYGSDYASTYFDKYMGNLGTLAGFGQNAANSSAAAGTNYANAYGMNVNNAAAATGGAALAGANSINSGINNALTLGAYYYGNQQTQPWRLPPSFGG